MSNDILSAALPSVTAQRASVVQRGVQNVPTPPPCQRDRPARPVPVRVCFEELACQSSSLTSREEATCGDSLVEIPSLDWAGSPHAERIPGKGFVCEIVVANTPEPHSRPSSQHAIKRTLTLQPDKDMPAEAQRPANMAQFRRSSGFLRGREECITVTEDVLERCGGDLNQLRKLGRHQALPSCPRSPQKAAQNQQAAGIDDFKQAFAQKCREVRALGDPWQGMENPEDGKILSGEDLLFSGVWFGPGSSKLIEVDAASSATRSAQLPTALVEPRDRDRFCQRERIASRTPSKCSARDVSATRGAAAGENRRSSFAASDPRKRSKDASSSARCDDFRGAREFRRASHDARRGPRRLPGLQHTGASVPASARY
eukprot:TRINITY_DN5209_c0_g1_i5.p1 TRINITY_DN5209_c0_g1~~TRINITY_DN5209_c0_g1_i5.p1  ORF type:complete len:372 (-),score=30.32 TRINITY_DN5209_c0_g1_i5:36-1151(-)